MTIDYTYDPLNRLTAADYSMGDSYLYTYDAVGNRLSQESMVNGLPSTVNYEYDSANRLASVNGVNYTFDDNGNLLSDGTDTYNYDSANRLISVNGTNTYAYNGLGDRLIQNGTQYTLDLNSGLTQVLSEGTTTYTYGLGRVSQLQGGNDAPEYYLTDALGSVRQLTHESGAIVLTRSYDPYGGVLSSSGSVDSMYGFTGEQTDPSGMVYLRARYYNPSNGLFATRDVWQGQITQPRTFHKWDYALDNPTRYADPAGSAPLPLIAFLMSRSAGEAVMYAKLFYSKAGSLRKCASEPGHGHSPSNMTVDDLLTDYICERGKTPLQFKGDARLTQQLARSSILQQLRTRFFATGKQYLKGRQYFDNSEFLGATIDSLHEGDPVRFVLPLKRLNITHFLGTFDYEIKRSGFDVHFRITNDTELRSGTRVPPILGGVHPSQEASATTVEDIIAANPFLASVPLPIIIATNPVISVLSMKRRDETRGLEGGGTMKQVFEWKEQHPFKCDPLPLALLSPLTVIR